MTTLLQRIVEPPTILADQDDRRTARTLIIILLTLLGASVLGIIGAGLQMEGGFRSPAVLAIGGLDVLLFIEYWLVKRGNLKLPAYLLPLSMIVLFTFVAYVGSGVHSITTHGFIIVIALASLLIGKDAPLPFATLSAAALALLTIGEINGFFVTPYSANTTYADLFIIAAFFTIAAVLLRIMMNNLTNSLERARRSEAELRKLNQELESRVQERTRDLEKARQEAVTAREAAEKANSVKSQFLANMSHELRTPLNAVLNFTSFVADGVMGPVNEEQVTALRQSIASSKHLLSLINDVLDISKIETGGMDLFVQEVDFNEILDSVVAVGGGLVKDKPVEIVAEVEEKLPTSYGDKRRLRQVFLNVVGNAVKFTPKGTIHVKAAKSEDGGIEVAIIDTGIGVAPEDQGAIFESFKQVKHDLPDMVGTGLGLSITKHFVESHGGTITVESELGKGSMFRIRLPHLTEERARALSKAAVTASME